MFVGLQAEDEPAQQVRWTEALETIAEERNSDRLRGFLQTGQDRACTLEYYSFPPNVRPLYSRCWELGYRDQARATSRVTSTRQHLLPQLASAGVL